MPFPPMSFTGRISSLTITVRDVGIVANGSNQRPFLREGLLFLSSSLEIADSSDNRTMRDDIGIKTLVNTDTVGNVYYRIDQKNGGRYIIDEIINDKMLGLTSCRVNLRSTQWSQNLLNELPGWTRM